MWCILAVAFLLHPPHLLLGAGLCAVMAESYLSLPLLSAYLSAFLTCANQPFRPLLRSRRPASALLAAVCDGTHDGNFCHFCPCCGAVAATGDDAVAVVVAPFLGVAVMVPVRLSGTPLPLLPFLVPPFPTTTNGQSEGNGVDGGG